METVSNKIKAATLTSGEAIVECVRRGYSVVVRPTWIPWQVGKSLGFTVMQGKKYVVQKTMDVCEFCDWVQQVLVNGEEWKQ